MHGFAKKTAHFVQPKQWASMRDAQKLEKETGRSIIHFEKGDYQGDDFSTPPHVLAAVKKAIDDGYVRYAPGPGMPALREEIAALMTKRGRPTTFEEVIVTAGAKHALMMSLLTFLEEGDEVIFPNPGYPPDEMWANFAGAVIRHMPLTPHTWQVDIEKLDSMLNEKTKLLIINTPQRPNGHLVSNSAEIAKLVQKWPRLTVISDEIFSQVVYDGAKHESIANLPGMAERTIVIDTFSKTWAMTGWRMGWAIAPKAVIDKLSIFLQDSITNVAAFVQLAGLAAITGPQEWVEKKRLALQRKRDLMIAALNTVPGLECQVPSGAFYAFPRITGTGLTSQEYADRLLLEAGVAVVAGTAFGSQGEGYIRMTYAVSDEDIVEGTKRMREAALKRK